ncbi:MAG: hypothetical protein AB7E47_13550 [Desulfovibrionaceae bacterium]
MTMFRSEYTSQSGIRILSQVLQQQVAINRSLSVTDKILSAYFWAKNVAEQYPDPVSGMLPRGQLDQEISRGLIKNLNV